MAIGTSSSTRPRASGLDDHRPGVLLITSGEGHFVEPAPVTVQRVGMTSSKLLSRTLAFQSSLRWPLERLHPHVLVSVTSGGGHDGEPALVTVQRAGMTSIKTPFPNTGIPKQFMIAIGRPDWTTSDQGCFSITSGEGHDGADTGYCAACWNDFFKTPFPNTGIRKLFMMAIGTASSTRPRASGLDNHRRGAF